MDTGSEPDAAGEGTQGAVGELGFSSGGRSAPEGVVPDPELVERASRRRFSAAYKLSDRARGRRVLSRPGEVGALLRREGLYSSLSDGSGGVQRDSGCAWTRSRRGGAVRRAPSPELVELAAVASSSWNAARPI